jgi:malate/lactate dehydrogenase
LSSRSQAGAHFADSLLRAIKGEDVTECTYVMSEACPGCEYFATEVVIGKDGVKEIKPIGKVCVVPRKCLTRSRASSF